jgi:hypothetical protein
LSQGGQTGAFLLSETKLWLTPFTPPLAWIAERLNIGKRGHLAWLLEQSGKGRLAASTDQCVLEI